MVVAIDYYWNRLIQIIWGNDLIRYAFNVDVGNGKMIANIQSTVSDDQVTITITSFDIGGTSYLNRNIQFYFSYR